MFSFYLASIDSLAAGHVGDEGDFLHQGLDAVDDVLDGVAAKARCDDHDVLDPSLANDGFSIFKTAQIGHHGGDGRFRRVVFEVADEIVADARIFLEIFEDDGRRLAGPHDQDGQLEQLEMAQDMLDEVAVGNEEEKGRQPEEGHEKTRRRGCGLGDVNQEDEGNHGVEDGFKDARNDLPELHAPRVEMVQL